VDEGGDRPGEHEPVDGVDVYWRPGCGFCDRLFAALEHHQVTVRRHNIWSDEEAAAFVRGQNDGSETVPTVRIGLRVATNPPPGLLIALVESEYPHLVAGSPA
jgi:glutaredoxin